jgi:hypothetical protein
MLRFVVSAFSFLVLAGALPAPAGALEPKKPSEVVTAIGRSTAPACPGVDESLSAKLVNQLAGNDGSVGTFAIPPKSVFVVQSFEFQLIGGNEDTFEALNLFAVDPAVPPTLTSSGSAAFAGGRTDANGTVVGNHVIPGGLVVEPPAALCFQARSSLTPLVAVHGFFAKDK